ncbi:MAG: single-stranded DNA-binding protein [Thermoanaerobacteraceae bacterium]|nr:single-stranded DNA-binding protein [Thermoanaerobacteraceae bacterium]
MLNHIILIGRLTRKPELKYTTEGKAVAGFTIAVERPFTNQRGEKDVDFIKVVVWEKLAEVVAKNLGKGRLVSVRGRLQVRYYEADDATKRLSAEVVADEVRFLDWPKEDKEEAS